MDIEIHDGAGKGGVARVDLQSRLRTHSVQIRTIEDATLKGDSYNLNSGLVTLTTAGESGILYVKNNEARDLHIDSVVVILGPSTNGVTTDTTRIRFYRNPTTGTLISTALAASDNENRNFGSGNTLIDSLVYKGATGNTITDGTVIIESLVSPGNREPIPIDLLLPKGRSLAISFEPNDSNTSMKCMAAVICHLEETNG